ncbi:MAG: SCO family protein [Planctomycetales bacterium]|nr:SCO family protein [Planctomycetales bacterium]
MHVFRVIAWLALVSVLPKTLHAQILLENLPPNVRGVEVTDEVGRFVPLGLRFTDDRGNPVALGKYFKQGKAIVLTLNYSDCPGLCIAQLDNLVATLREMDTDDLGSQFEIVTVSIDPHEDSGKAARTKDKYTRLLPPEAADSWHFLVGKQQEILELAKAVGFHYVYDPVNKRYNHPAAMFFISSNGRISRYLLSLGVEPQQMKLAIGDASEGKLAVESLSDALVQLCYTYDPEANRYSANAKRILAIGAAGYVVFLLAFIAPFWFGSKKAIQGAANEPAASVEAAAIPEDTYTMNDPLVGAAISAPSGELTDSHK